MIYFAAMDVVESGAQAGLRHAGSHFTLEVPFGPPFNSIWVDDLTVKVSATPRRGRHARGGSDAGGEIGGAEQFRSLAALDPSGFIPRFPLFEIWLARSCHLVTRRARREEVFCREPNEQHLADRLCSPKRRRHPRGWVTSWSTRTIQGSDGRDDTVHVWERKE